MEDLAIDSVGPVPGHLHHLAALGRGNPAVRRDASAVQPGGRCQRLVDHGSDSPASLAGVDGGPEESGEADRAR